MQNADNGKHGRWGYIDGVPRGSTTTYTYLDWTNDIVSPTRSTDPPMFESDSLDAHAPGERGTCEAHFRMRRRLLKDKHARRGATDMHRRPTQARIPPDAGPE